MSRFGDKHFDGDMEAEYLQIFADQIIDRVRKIVLKPPLMEPDEYESIEMLGGLDILLCLSRWLDSNGVDEGNSLFLLPDEEEIRSWKESYLSVWEKWMDEVNPKAQKSNRRKEIERTFDGLVRKSDEQRQIV